MRKRFLRSSIIGSILLASGLFLLSDCSADKREESSEHTLATDVALEWNRLMLDLERHTPGYRPPVSARTFAYVEMTAYEASLPSLEGYVSLEKTCPGYSRVKFSTSGEQFFLPASLNVAYAQSLRHFFSNAPSQWRDKIDQIETSFKKHFLKKTDKQSVEHSEAYGKSVAQAVWQWSATDTEGHESYLYNFDKNYVPPVCAGCWQPDAKHPVPALLPHWEKVRGFVAQAGDFELKPPVPFDESPGSAFHTEAMEVFSVSQPLSRENHWIAELWSDDLPGLTVTPVGRWISIANQAVAQVRPPFPIVMETYLKTAIALYDVSIVTWHSKYKFNLERPQSYIERNIKPGWAALHENPSFPAYPSGHSAFGAAAAEVMSELLGQQFQLTDRTHENRQEFVGKPRTYNSFEEMAKENAASRVLIGVHYRMDCEEGLRLGKAVGRKVAALPLRQKEAAMVRPQ
jgi:hypothetical protein